MALVIEDGSGVTGANSYNSVTALREYAVARGESLPTADAEVEALAIQATDYMEQFRLQYQGDIVDPLQALAFPREGVVIDGYEYPATTLPSYLARAHAQATIEAYTSELIPNPSQSVKKEKVDVIEVEYQDTSTSAVGFPKVEMLLRPLFSSRNPFSIGVVRA
tara:strand:- start:10474 stop:10965 length:492 start_codon:yes stop_codon:yes gene_type:complete